MKVGVYIGKIDAQDGGGYTFQQSVLEALSDAVKDSMEFLLLYYGDEPKGFDIQSISIKPDFNFRIKSKFKRVLGIKKPTSFLNVILERMEIDIVWFPTYHFESVDVPYIFTVWDLQHRLQPMFPEVSKGDEWDRRELLFRNALKKASYILTGTERGMDEVSLFYQIPRERIRKLPHPTPNLLHLEAADIEQLLPSNLWNTYILYPAQFWPHKNHIRILQAISFLKEEKKIIIPAVFVGSDKATKSYLAEMSTKLGIDTQIHFLGFVTKHELVSLYKNAFSIVYPSLFGPENLPPLEAFLLNCPAIVSDVPGAREQYGDAALFFDPLNSKELAQQIYTLWGDPNLRRLLIEKGLHRSTMYQPKHYIQDIFKILMEFNLIRLTWSSS